MKKNFMSVQIDTDNGILLRNGEEIKCPYDIYVAFEFLERFDYLKYNYKNDEEELWDITNETRNIMLKCDYPISEEDAIDMACERLNIVLE